MNPTYNILLQEKLNEEPNVYSSATENSPKQTAVYLMFAKTTVPRYFRNVFIYNYIFAPF